MPNRWGLGPVFAYESLAPARWQVYAARSFFVLVLLVGMVMVWVTKDQNALMTGVRVSTFAQMAKVGEGFFYALAGIQVSLVLLAAPAAAAGSICMDRARGTLLHMFVTDLSDTEIVLGKLGSRLAPVFGLLACGLPVSALAALLGGIDFGALAGAFVVSLALAVFGCALALAISIRAAKTHEVLMAVYMAEALWLLALPIWWINSRGSRLITPPDWFQKANPYVIVFAPYNTPGFVGILDYTCFVVTVLSLSALLVGLTIWRLRRAVIEQSGRPEKRTKAGFRAWRIVFPSWTGPTLDGNPVLWREWHRNRPSRLARGLWNVLLVGTWIMAAWGTYDLIRDGVQPGPNGLSFGFLLQLFFGFLMLSAMAPTALAEERVRGSLDVLLATPMSTASIVVAKWWGMYRWVLLLAILPLYTAIFLAAASPALPSWALTARLTPPAIPLTVQDRVLSVTFCLLDFLVSGALIVSLGLALATWIARLGRAVAISVIAYFLHGIGWIFLVQLIFSAVMNLTGVNPYLHYRWALSSVLSFSPIAGPINALDALVGFAQEPRTALWVGATIVAMIKFALSVLFLWLTVVSFDRCFGRVSEMPTPARRRKIVLVEEPESLNV